MDSGWTIAFNEYRYPFDLQRYDGAAEHPGWFVRASLSGDPLETKAFEDYFRAHARDSLEPWFEVVYWKVYNQPLARNKTTRAVIRRLRLQSVSPTLLWDRCNRFVDNPTRDNFEAFRVLLVATNALAVAATFPAFIDPVRFPMVDRRVARWVATYASQHNASDPEAPRLLTPETPVLLDKAAVLTMRDFHFYQQWIHWCRYTARKLGEITGQPWRARDVEMAVFCAWGRSTDKRLREPPIYLEPLPGV